MLIHLTRKDPFENDLVIEHIDSHIHNEDFLNHVREAIETLLQDSHATQTIQEDGGIQLVWDMH